jgi:hypothetical protein
LAPFFSSQHLAPEQISKKCELRDVIYSLLPPPLIQPVNSQNGGFSYLQEKALERILKITWFEHLARTIIPAPTNLARS